MKNKLETLQVSKFIHKIIQLYEKITLHTEVFVDSEVDKQGLHPSMDVVS
jgi:hypothetical protein